tara:strand:+ start:1528 stop:1644 length:117 start_codon:yes stop_codon:yes gene_type:complete
MKYEFDPTKSEGFALFLIMAVALGGTLVLNFIVWSFIG